MYRVRSPNKSIPLLIAKPVIQDYSVNDVDTLHKKNLLSLGEDRYLTTLMLKHFPNMKISFTADAMCKTYAPERWSVLLSQRRRWINSTVHNLAELLLLPQLCGFCCFSMRFIVFFDLFATLVMPATMAYLGYLIYMAIVNQQIFPMVSLILICAAYGLQVIIFLLKRKWEHIGWMIIYILALPMFTFFIPIYSFWHFDDFSWGNTRVVVGEKGGKKQILDEEPFDPLSIPMKRWSDYEQEMFENESNATGMTQGSYTASHVTQSVMNPSMVGSQYQAVYGVPPPGYPQAMSYASRGSAVMSRPVSMVHAPAKQMNVAGRTEEYPSDEQIAAQIKTILATANLMTVTKKQVRDELAAFFNTDMNSRKTFINKVIEDVLKGKM
jgi:chitin synthase